MLKGVGAEGVDKDDNESGWDHSDSRRSGGVYDGIVTACQCLCAVRAWPGERCELDVDS